jgi:hypothetical protein
MRDKLDLSLGRASGHRLHQQIVDFWSSVRACDDPGAASWGELEVLERAVTDCLAMRPPNLAKAESLTAKAMLLMISSGNI